MSPVWQDTWAGLRAELRPMFRVAWPVAVAELGWMTMGLVDTMMVGRVSAEAIGGVSVGSNLFFAVAVFGLGVLLGLDFLVSHAVGAGRHEDARRALAHGAYVSIALGAALTIVLLALSRRLDRFGIQPAVAAEAAPYLCALAWGMTPLLLYTSLRRYLQAVGAERLVMIALVSANAINAVVDWILVFGHLGAPALGAEGAGWATFASRVYLLGFLAASVAWHERRAGAAFLGTWGVDVGRVRALLRLGLPAAMQMLLEVGVFAAATLLAGRLAADQLAAHQIALSAASFTFMVPLGISSAAAVRVGQSLGRIDAVGASRAGWTALLLGLAFMSGAAIAFVVVPRWIIRVFTADPGVIDTGVALLRIAALFQLFDGFQVVATGALRGAGDTRSPMLANLFGYWGIGLPVGYVLCFWHDLDVVGLWIGLCTGLIAVALVLTAVWSARSRLLAQERRIGVAVT